MGLFNFLFNKESKSHDETKVSNQDSVELSGDDTIIPRADEQHKQLNFMEERVKYFYEHPETLVDIEFFNRTNALKNIWVEPACTSIDLDNDTEYKIVTHDRFFRIEFDKDNQVIFYLQYSFGFKLYKRPASDDVTNKNEWVLDYDCSDIN